MFHMETRDAYINYHTDLSGNVYIGERTVSGRPAREVVIPGDDVIAFMETWIFEHHGLSLQLTDNRKPVVLDEEGGDAVVSGE